MPRPLLGTRFTEYREPVWFGLGKYFASPVTASVAVKGARIDTKIDAVPLDLPYGKETVTISDKLALIRAPLRNGEPPHLLGLASSDYTVLQTRDLAAILDPLSQACPVQVAGEIRDGATVCFVLRCGPRTVGPVALRDYWLITDQRDGKGALTLAYMPVVDKSMATLLVGTSSKVSLLSVRHGRGMRDELAYRLSALGSLNEVGNRLAADYERLAAVQLTDDDARGVVAAAYPTPKRGAKARYLDEVRSRPADDVLPDAAESDAVLQDFETAEDHYEWTTERVTDLRATALDLWRSRAASLWPSGAGSALLLWHSIAELSDFSDAGRAEFSAVQAIYGAKALEKQRAYEALAERYLR